MSKQKIGILCLFLILALLSIRTILLTPGTVGHNWDWSIPSSVSYLQHFVQSLPFTWRSFSLGEPISLWLPSIPFSFLFYSPSFLGLGGDFISKFLMISTIVLSGMGMFLLVENILQKEWKLQKTFFASFLAGFFYAFSPFLFAELIGGATTQFFAYALIPWLLFFFRRLNQEKKKFWLYLLFSTLTLSLITISLQVLVLSSLILIFYLLIQNKKLTYFRNLIFIYLSYLFLNFYWILPTLAELRSIQTTVSGGLPFSFFTIQNLVPSLAEAFISAGYTRPFFLSTINEKILPIWFLIIFLGLIFVLWRNLASHNKESLFWSLVFLLSLIFATGGKEPLGNQVVWLYQNFPLMSLFRSPQHFIVLPTLSTAILIGFAFARLKTRSFSVKFLVFLFLIIWLYPFFEGGDLGTQKLRIKKMEHLEVYRLSPGYQEIFDFIKQDGDDYKILFLPMSGSPYYLKTEYQNESQGGDPLVEYSFRDTITTDVGYGSQGKVLALELEKSFCERKNQEVLTNVLGMMNIKYLILRKDVIPHFSDCKNWSWQEVYQFLLGVSGLTELNNEDYVILFQNKKFLPHFLVSNKVNTEEEPKSLFSKKFFSVNQENLPNLNSKKINPVSYQLKITKAEGPYFLVFSESFNPGWKVYFEGREIGKHFKANTFANAWYIDQLGDYNLTVEYQSQKLFWLGSMLSLLFFVSLVGIVIKNLILK